MIQPAHEIILRGRGPNTMSLSSLSRLIEQVRASDGAPLLIRGEGNAFSAGLDLEALHGVPPASLVAQIEEAARVLFLHPGPTVACINGHAIAGGCMLALACDHRVLSADPMTRVGMTAVALGLPYPPSILQLLRYRLPRHALALVLLGAQRFSPTRALELGLVDELAEDPFDLAHARLKRLASHPATAYAETKRALRADVLRVDPDEHDAFVTRGLPAWEPAAVLRRLHAIRKQQA